MGCIYSVSLFSIRWFHFQRTFSTYNLKTKTTFFKMKQDNLQTNFTFATGLTAHDHGGNAVGLKSTTSHPSIRDSHEIFWKNQRSHNVITIMNYNKMEFWYCYHNDIIWDLENRKMVEDQKITEMFYYAFWPLYPKT